MRRSLSSVLLVSLLVVTHGLAWSKDTTTSADLIRKADTDKKPAGGFVEDQTTEYLRLSLKTDKPIHGTAEVVKRIDEKCIRARVTYRIPEFIVTAKNPSNPQESKTGPFEASIEGNFCDNG